MEKYKGFPRYSGKVNSTCYTNCMLSMNFAYKLISGLKDEKPSGKFTKKYKLYTGGLKYG